MGQGDDDEGQHINDGDDNYDSKKIRREFQEQGDYIQWERECKMACRVQEQQSDDNKGESDYVSDDDDDSKIIGRAKRRQREERQCTRDEHEQNIWKASRNATNIIQRT